MSDNTLLVPEIQSNCLEENITIGDENLLYSLSNSLDEIEMAIFAKIGENINLKNTSWKLNTRLSAGVKYSMNQHQVKYSMTIFNKDDTRQLVVNMRDKNDWFFTGYTEIGDNFYSWEFIEKIEFAENYKKKSSGKSSKKTETKDLTLNNFIIELDSLYIKRKYNEITDNSLYNAVKDLLKQYKTLYFCQKIKRFRLNKNDFYLFLCFCHLFINNNDDYIGFNEIKSFYEDRIIVHEIIRSLSDGDNILIKNNYIELNYNVSYYTEHWRLSGKIKKELFSIDHHNHNNAKNNSKNTIAFNSIKNKKMHYNTRESEAIQTLNNLLQEENYKIIQDKLEATGMRKGFACLFSGAPGTGKTETAYQIARETKRNIIKVDVAETKSCWVGESEKNIREVFNNYRTAANSLERTPILLLNEADAIIHKRKELDAKSGSADKSDNAVQNIILEELESFSGILIATTNFTQSIDSAFERRFLYKINFDNPNAENRKLIWKDMLPELPEDITSELSGKFDLSGGQIENIARKSAVDSVITGTDPSMDSLLKYCEEENENIFSNSRRIGFGN